MDEQEEEEFLKMIGLKGTTPKLQCYRDSQGDQFEITVGGAQWD